MHTLINKLEWSLMRILLEKSVICLNFKYEYNYNILIYYVVKEGHVIENVSNIFFMVLIIRHRKFDKYFKYKRM